MEINDKIIKDVILRKNEYKYILGDKAKDQAELNNFTYQFNSEKFRSIEFDKNIDILVLGCSHTFGEGLPFDFLWHQLLSKKMNLTVSNLALPGEAANGQIIKAFEYFNKYGNPKILIGMFPLLRLELPMNSKKMYIKRLKNNAESCLSRNENLMQRSMLDLNNFNKYSKAPHDPEKILPEEYALYFLHVYIYMLEQYCKTNNIIFIWNVWEHEYCDVYEKTKKYETSVFNNYLHINSHFDNLFAMDCHSEYKTHKLFDYAADSQHWGIHKHIHLFEEIYKNLQEKIKK